MLIRANNVAIKSKHDHAWHFSKNFFTAFMESLQFKVNNSTLFTHLQGSLMRPMKRGDSLVLRTSGETVQETAIKHSAQAFRIPQMLSEQSSKNFGICQNKDTAEQFICLYTLSCLLGKCLFTNTDQIIRQDIHLVVCSKE